MIIVRQVFVTLFLTSAVVSANAQTTSSADSKNRQQLETTATFCGYPGGMLFHTAFHGRITTRYLLLKTALHSQPVAQFLQLSEQQQMHVRKLSPIKSNSKLSDRDTNDQPDETVVDPKYFDFLQVDQLAKLDALAFYFDGYVSLTRRSMADRVKLSDGSRDKIKRTIGKYREDLFLTRIRWNFAARLPDDIKYQDCDFTGRFSALVNFKTIDILTEIERERVADFIRTNSPPNEIITAVQNLAPLPEGIIELRKFAAEADAPELGVGSASKKNSTAPPR